MAKDILIDFIPKGNDGKFKRTWRRTFRDRNKKLPIELDSIELYTIAGALKRQSEYLKKGKRYKEAEEVEKLEKQFDGFWEFAVNNG